jgi:hypothetical protein
MAVDVPNLVPARVAAFREFNAIARFAPLLKPELDLGNGTFDEGPILKVLQILGFLQCFKNLFQKRLVFLLHSNISTNKQYSNRHFDKQ